MAVVAAVPRVEAQAAPRNLGDQVLRVVLRAAALTLVLLVLAMVVSMVHASWPAMRAFGWRFLASSTWDPVAEQFGAIPFIYGTLLSSLLALLIAVPLGVGVGPPADRIPRGAGGRRPVRHLRALGHLRPGPAPEGLGAAGPRQIARVPAAVPGPTLRRRHARGRDHPGDHGRAVHRRGEPRGAPGGAEHPARGGAGARRHALGDHAHRGAALRPLGPCRRGPARSGPRAGRDHGRDDGDRQSPGGRDLSVRA